MLDSQEPHVWVGLDVVEPRRVALAAYIGGDQYDLGGIPDIQQRRAPDLTGFRADALQEPDALGLPFEVLASPRPHWREQRVPVRLDPAGGHPRWFGPSN